MDTRHWAAADDSTLQTNSAPAVRQSQTRGRMAKNEPAKIQIKMSVEMPVIFVKQEKSSRFLHTRISYAMCEIRSSVWSVRACVQ